MRLKWLPLLGLLTACLGGTQGPSSQTYTVALMILPQRLTPRTPSVNTDWFIYQHLYYPAIERDVNNQLQSRVLDLQRTRALSDDFKLYQFCLRPQAKFSDASPILPSDLLAMLESVHRDRLDMPDVESFREVNGCIEARLLDGDPFYLDKFTDSRSTLIKAGTENLKAPVGIGPYHLEVFEPHRLRLVATEGEEVGTFKAIEFLLVEGQPASAPEPILDWNYLYNVPIPESLRQGKQQSLDRVLNKVYFLMVNLPTKEQRFRFAECFNRRKFTEAAGLKLFPTIGYMARGMPGSKVSYERVLRAHRSRAACTASQARPEVIYTSYNSLDHARVKDFFAQEDKQLPVRVKVEPMSLKDTVSRALSHRTMLSLVGDDTANPDSREFFPDFVGAKRFIPFISSEFDEEVKLAASARSPDESARHAYRAHHLLLESGYVLPLGQLIIRQYYRADISSIQYNEAFKGFPLIHRMRVN